MKRKKTVWKWTKIERRCPFSFRVPREREKAQPKRMNGVKTSVFKKRETVVCFLGKKKKKKKKGGSKKNIQSSKTSQQSFHEAGPRERERERKVLELLFTSIPLEKNGRCVSNCWRVRPLPDDSPRTKGRRRKIQQRLCVFLNSASVTIWNAFHQHHLSLFLSLENQYLFFFLLGGGGCRRVHTQNARKGRTEFKGTSCLK